MTYTFNRQLRGVYFAMVLAALIGARPAGASEAVDVSFSLRDPTVTLHEPIFVTLSVRNDLKEGIQFDLGFDAKEGVRFSVKQPEGLVITLPAYSRGGLGIGGKQTLGVGEVYTQTILFNEFYAPNMPGSYVITARLAAQSQTDSGRVLRPASASTLDLQVGERDPGRLAAVCESLARKSTKGGDYQSVYAASFALRYVVDAVAIPYLGRVLMEGDPRLGRFAATGLARIGTPEAAEVLKSVLNATKDPILRHDVEGALWEIRTGKVLVVND